MKLFKNKEKEQFTSLGQFQIFQGNGRVVMEESIELLLNNSKLKKITDLKKL